MQEVVDAPDRQRLRRLQGYVEQDPGNALLLADAWQAAAQAGEPALAAGFARQAGAAEPAREALWLQREAHALVDAGQLGQAQAVLEQARDRGLPALLADHDLACIALREGRFDRAVEITGPWLQGDPAQDPDAIALMQASWLRSMHRLGRVQAAWRWVEGREQGGQLLSPAAAGPASLLAIDADRFGDAQRLAERALQARVDDAEALTASGCVAIARGETAHAEHLLGLAERQTAADGRVQSALGLAALQAGRMEQARQRFERAVAGMASHVGSWHGLGWSLLLQGRLGDAEAAFRRAVDLDPNFGESHGALGLALLLQGDRTAAEPCLRRAHKLDPRNVTASFAAALGAGRLSPAQFNALARRLLDRPGFFGEKLSARWAERPMGEEASR